MIASFSPKETSKHLKISIRPIFTALGIFVYLIQVGLGGPLFGYVMARLTIWWLSRVFNDAVVEITITLASTYFTYYVGDELLGVSGVLAVVTLGVEINARRTNISPEVEAFLLKYVECIIKPLFTVLGPLFECHT